MATSQSDNSRSLSLSLQYMFFVYDLLSIDYTQFSSNLEGASSSTPNATVGTKSYLERST